MDLSTFLLHLQQLIPQPTDKKYLLAVSGGADSMVLAYLFMKARLNFEVAHVNYHLREADSNLDEAVVKEFCTQHGFAFHRYEVSAKDNKPEKSIEMWARNIRYHFFFNLLEARNLDYIATAHHLNDQLETFLINLSRGSGLAGLTGIPSGENRVIRPLLHFTKQEIYDFAQKHHIVFREDKTNAEDHYLRNRIRHHITPWLEKTHSHFWKNLNTSFQNLAQSKQFIQEQIEVILDKLVLKRNSEELILDKHQLLQQSPFVRYEILKLLGFPKAEEQEKLLQAENGKRFTAEKGYIFIHQNQLIFRNEDLLPQVEEEILLKINETIISPKKLLITNEKQSHQKEVWEINATKITLPLKLRKPQPGEYFYPVGMQGKKRIAKFLRDQKIPIFVRSQIWLLSDAQNQILGIVGYRQDRRFAAGTHDKKIYVYP